MFGLAECYLFIFIFILLCFTIFFPPVSDRIRECNTSKSYTKICQICILASYVFICLGILYYMSKNNLYDINV